MIVFSNRSKKPRGRERTWILDVNEKTFRADGRLKKMIRTAAGIHVVDLDPTDEDLIDEAPHEEAAAEIEEIANTCSQIQRSHRRETMEFPQLDDLALAEAEIKAIEDAKPTAVKMGFIGAGQGGCRIADEFHAQGYNRVLLVNTTEQDMAGLACENKIIIGKQQTGAGKSPAVGKRAAEDSREDVLRACKRSFGPDVEWIFVCCGGGGGTGTGSTPILIDVAKDYLVSLGKEPKVGVIISFPKKSEGQAVTTNAQSLMGTLLDLVEKKAISPLIVMDNDKIGKMFAKASIANFYKVANRNICGLFNVFNELAVQPSAYSTLDPSDFKSVLASGVLVLGMTVLPQSMDDETAIAAAIEKNLKTGLFSDSFSLKGATHAAGVLVTSKANLETIPQEGFDSAFETLQRVMGSGSLVLHSGIYEGNDSMDRVFLYTLCGGLK